MHRGAQFIVSESKMNCASYNLIDKRADLDLSEDHLSRLCYVKWFNIDHNRFL
jgi:hypothetical protein